MPWPDGEPAVLGPRCARAAAKCAIVASIWLHCDHPSSCPYSLTACAISAFSGLPQLQAALLGTTIQILLSPLQVLANSALDCHSPGHRDMVITTSLNAAGLVAPPCPSGIGRRLFKYDLYSMGCPDRPVTTSIANPAASRAAFACPLKGAAALDATYWVLFLCRRAFVQASISCDLGISCLFQILSHFQDRAFAHKRPHTRGKKCCP